MSYWTHMRGMITVSPIGRTQHEKRYVLETVLDHLPVVTGSEGGMHVDIVQRPGYSDSINCDEFNERTNNLIEDDRFKSRDGWMRIQASYHLIVDADLRDVTFTEGLRMFEKWLCRLSKRVFVDDIMVNIRGNWAILGTDSQILITNAEPYYEMFESDNNWCHYLLWKPEAVFGMTEKEIRDNNGCCQCGAVIQSYQWRMCPRCGMRFVEREEYDANKENYFSEGFHD